MAFLCAVIGGILGFMLTDLEPSGAVVGLIVGLCIGLVIKERRQEAERAKKNESERQARDAAGGAGSRASARKNASRPKVDTTHWSESDKLRWDLTELQAEVAELRDEVERLSLLVAEGESRPERPAAERAVADRTVEASASASPVAREAVPDASAEAGPAPAVGTPAVATPADSPLSAGGTPFASSAEPAPFESLERAAAYEVFEPTRAVDVPEMRDAAAEPGQTEAPQADLASEDFSAQPASAAGDAASAPARKPEAIAPAASTSTLAAAPSLAAKAIAWFTQGNTMVRVGVVVLFFGLAFLLKYAADQDLIPIELRLITAGLFGLALLGLGWRLRRKRPDFALPVQGGGVAIFYLTSLAAAKLMAADGASTVLPVGAAFLFMAGICILSTMLAVLQRDQIMALLSFAGGRLAPILLSTGEGNHIVLFSFYALLTLGEIGILRFLPWRLLPLVSFAFTAGVGAVWGVRSYVPEFFPEAEGFLLLFFFLYAGISVYQALKGAKDRLRFCDVLLVFAVPLTAGTMQWHLLRDTEFGMAFSCLGLGAVYLGIASFLRNKTSQARGFLFDSALALGVAALTLAVPFALSRDLTAAAWCVEGAALVWICARMKRPEGVTVGLLLQIIAGGLYIVMVGEAGLATSRANLDPLMPMFAEAPVLIMFLNKLFIGGALLALAGLVSARAMSRIGEMPDAADDSFLERLRAGLRGIASAHALPAWWALFWWCFAGVSELFRHLDEPRNTALLGFCVLTTIAVLGWSRLSRMAKSRAVAAAIVPALLLMAFAHAVHLAEWFPDTGRPWYELVAWLPALAFALFTLRRVEVAALPRAVLAGLHVGLVWAFCLVAGSEFVAFVAREVPEGVWQVCAGGVVPAIILLVLSRIAPRPAWPLGAFERAYLGIAPLPLAGFLALWLFLCLWGRGDPSPLPYIPVLNPLDLTLALGVTALIVWVRALRARQVAPVPMPRPVVMLVAVLLALFLWWNVALLRGLHHLGGYGFSLDDFLWDRTLQKCLAAGWIVFTAGLLGFLRSGERRRAALIACVPVLALTFFWALVTNWSDGGGPLGAVPFLNALDMIQIAAFALAVHVWAGLFRECLGRTPVKNEKVVFGAVAAGMVVFWLHAVLLRTLHHWLGIPFELGELLRSDKVQAAISVFWTLLAVGPILYSKWKKVRPAWILGAGILGLTVCKLFLVDLSKLSGLERVISFIVAGVILLIIGYLCPLPPKHAEGRGKGEEE